MLDTSARLLRLLALLQSRPEWRGADLAERLDVAARTLRRDIGRLRELGYPVHATPGVAGGYRLGAGARMPPLLLDDEEAVAVAIGLRGGGVAGIEETAGRALAKLEQVLPDRLRQRVRALQTATVAIGGGVPAADAGVLDRIAAARRDREVLRFDYRDHDGAETARSAEPCKLVARAGRWYLLGYDLGRDGWRIFRVDRLRPRTPNGPRFAPRPEPGGDAARYVAERLVREMWPVRARALVHAPAAQIAARTSGLVEPVDDRSCLLELRADGLDAVVFMLGLLDADFEVLEPPELAGRLRTMADRFARAAGEGWDGR
ncbi:helix-turn-helix transcriptional regulator [Actinomadura macrotermitis]|uniref:HTH deoR-type domain-containing protein n=1 Tax=Actinomadura macrotermitis TaxID=2585200 RepID=A0A7K0C0N3_9ACTN|nr:YafY family protein [Actinomadura macrotermitis]MQY06632.1 hypothetical protein [Actinomadura macrotermitis]